jgi:transposase
VLRRAEFYYQQLDALRPLRHEVRRELLSESKKHPATKLLCQIPAIGPIRAALLIALIQTPHRFRSKRPVAAEDAIRARASLGGLVSSEERISIQDAMAALLVLRRELRHSRVDNQRHHRDGKESR